MIHNYVKTSFEKIIGALSRPEHVLLVQNAAWVAVPFGISQVIRLGTSVILAWLLAPELLGLMLLINTLRTGAELLTDVGIGQSIVANKIGGFPEFYNTAWTIQIIRGVALFFFASAAAAPAASAFENPELYAPLLAIAPIFLLTGLTAPSRFLLQKSLQVRAQALFDLSMAAVGSLIQIALAWAMPTIWSLIIGLLLATALPMICSYFMMDWRTLRLHLDMNCRKEIFLYGRWIFLSSTIYFFAMNYDRLYLAKIITIAFLGVFGIAKTFSEAINMLFGRLSQVILFPMISSTERRGADLRQAILPIRFWVLFGVAIALAFLVSVADEFISLVYDARYAQAGIIMTVLLFGAWFAVLAAMADAIMMGIGKPAGMAVANGTKFLFIAIGLPLAAANIGFVGCLGVLVSAELFRYAAQAASKRSMGLSFSRQDVMMTLLFIALSFIFREVSSLMGLTGGVMAWVEQLKALNA